MHHPAAPEHAQHDTTRIAEHAAGDCPDATAIEGLLSTCPSCAQLHRDLVAIAAATRELTRTARAPRDFRLSPAQADSLRRGSWLRTLLRPFASRRAASTFATLLTSAGVAGLLVAAFVPTLLGGSAAAPNRDASSMAQQAIQATGAAAAPAIAGATDARGPVAAGGGPSDSAFIKAGDSGDAGMEVALGAGTPGTANDDVRGGPTSAGQATTLGAGSRPNLLVVASIAMLAVGLALFGLRLAARRLR